MDNSQRNRPSLRCTSSKLESNPEDWTETFVRKAKRPSFILLPAIVITIYRQTFATASHALQLAENDKLRHISSCAARAKAAGRRNKQTQHHAPHTHCHNIFNTQVFFFGKIRLRISAENAGARDFSRLGAALLQGNSYLADGNPFIPVSHF